VAPASGPVPAMYDVYLHNDISGSVLAARVGGSSTTLTGLWPNQQYSVIVRAADASSNEAPGAAVNVRTLPDLVAPSRPGAPTLNSRGQTRLHIAWKASHDNISVDHYLIYKRVGTKWSRVDYTFYRSDLILHLRSHTRYVLRIVAIDSSGN